MLYEGSRRVFFFSSKKKKSRRGKIPKVSKLSGKRTVTGQHSGELYTGTGFRLHNFTKYNGKCFMIRFVLLMFEKGIGGLNEGR